MPAHVLAKLQLFGTVIAFVPLIALGVLHWRGLRRDVAYWWLAAAFLVSGIVDALGYVMAEDAHKRLSDLYLILQCAIIAAVFLTRVERWIVAACLVCVGVYTVLTSEAGLDIALVSVASLAVCGIVYDRPALGHLRSSLLVYFGATLVVNLAAFFYPHPPMGLLYHSTRLAGLLWFCVACWRPHPQLRAA